MHELVYLIPKCIEMATVMSLLEAHEHTTFKFEVKGPYHLPPTVLNLRKSLTF